MLTRMRITGLLLAGSVAMAACQSRGEAAPKFEQFVGYWTGTGSVVLANGSKEQLKCVATYKLVERQLRQTLRCASPGYSINATADLAISGDVVIGAWEERTYSAVGSITGRVTADGLQLSIQGATFSAVLTLVAATCRQSIQIAPQGLEVSNISIALGKC